MIKFQLIKVRHSLIIKIVVELLDLMELKEELIKRIILFMN